jgi:hypothetical protein
MNFDLSMKRTPNQIMEKLYVTIVFTAFSSLLQAGSAVAEGQMESASEAVVTPLFADTFLESADIDGDGIPDLISGVSGNRSVQILLNSSTNSGAQAASKNNISTLNFATEISNVFFADLNRDRLPELITASNSGAAIQVQRNRSSSGVAMFDAGNSFNTSASAHLMFACDLNMDGYQDILAATNSTLSILKNNCTAKGGDIQLKEITELNVNGFINSIKCADADGDGNIDIIAATANGILVYSGNGSGFDFKLIYNNDDYVSVSGMDIGDLDGDYLPEVVLAHFPQNNFSILRNISHSGSTAFNAEEPITCAGSSDIALCDYNQDGLFDVITLANGQGWNVAQIFNNKTTAQGRFIFATPKVVPVSGNHFEISDFDNNGTDDIAAVNPTNNKVAIAYNNASGNQIFQLAEVFCGEDGLTWISWVSNADVANSKYIIEKTINGIDFVEAGSIDAKPGNIKNEYTYSLNQAIGEAAGYRIKLKKVSGETVFSEIFLIEPCDAAVTDFSCVFPNPVDKQMNFGFSLKTTTEINFEILDSRMQPVLVKTESVTPGTRTYTLDIDELAKGSYLLAVRFGNLAPEVCRFEKL